MSMKSERLQVLIEPEQRALLEREAAARGTSVATLVRDAIDLAFPSGLHLRHAAAESILAADPMPAPELDSLLEELRELRGRRA